MEENCFTGKPKRKIKTTMIICSPRFFGNTFFPCIQCQAGRAGKPYCLPFGFLYVPPCCSVNNVASYTPQWESTTASTTTMTTSTTTTSTSIFPSTPTTFFTTITTTTTTQTTSTETIKQDPSLLYNTRGKRTSIIQYMAIKFFYNLQSFTGCGLSNTRIIGGEEVTENEFPWMCSILFSDYQVQGKISMIPSCWCENMFFFQFIRYADYVCVNSFLTWTDHIWFLFIFLKLVTLTRERITSYFEFIKILIF